ncbi:MAG: APC family permease [Clostridiales bacterium]|nr:APC family permease [Clostridiales bacterium]MDD6389531.1 APC family permease [Bacillota bacterium]
MESTNEKRVSNVDSLKKVEMTPMGVAMVVFCLVAAGCFGIEEMIPEAGPGMTILMLILFPFIWGLPISLQIAEMGSIIPSEGGLLTWCRETMGEFWGWQAGFWGGLTIWLSNAEYCVLVAGYIEKYIPMSPTGKYAVEIGMVLLFSFINIIGIKEVSILDTIFTIATIAAFGAVMVVGFANWNFNPIEPFYNHEEGVLHSIGGSIAVCIWMFCGYECISNMAQEVKNPQVIPKGLILSQPIIGLSYVLPTLAALAAVGSWNKWAVESGDGTVGYIDVLIQYAGNWAAIAFLVIAVVSNCAIFSSYIAPGARLFFVLADDFMFPRGLCKVSRRFKSPHVAIIVLACITIVCCKLDFETLVMATTPLQLFLYILLAVAVLRMRKMYPAEWRKEKGLYVVPFGKPGLYISIVLSFGISCIAIYLNGIPYFIASFILMILSLVIYCLCKWRYGGLVNINEEAYPLNRRTRLGLGDTINIGLFILIFGVMSLAGAGVFSWYEGSYGKEYYFEEFGNTVFGNFDLQVSICLWAGLAMTIAGAAVFYIGLKNEKPLLKQTEALRKKERDDMICSLHGWKSL